MPNRLTIDHMHRIAKERGGKCLSTTYINNHSNLTWQCREGHQWDALPNTITRGCWCPVCKGCKKKTLSDMQRLAQTHGGKCLSTRYTNSHSNLIWQCREGHQWETTLASINRGSWCPVCRGDKKKTLEHMQRLAKAHGGKCLSPKYTDARTKLLWQCREGHQWQATPTAIQGKKWCPVCKPKKLLSDKLQLYAFLSQKL